MLRARGERPKLEKPAGGGGAEEHTVSQGYGNGRSQGPGGGGGRGWARAGLGSSGCVGKHSKGEQRGQRGWRCAPRSGPCGLLLAWRARAWLSGTSGGGRRLRILRRRAADQRLCCAQAVGIRSLPSRRGHDRQRWPALRKMNGGICPS